MRSAVSALFDLTGRTALVTGASSGIGAAIAEALDGAGARVLRAGRDRDRLGPDGISADLTHGAGELIEQADARADAVDILVNCAGSNPRPPLGDIDEALYRAILAVNLDAPFQLGQHYGPRMARAAGAGSSTSPRRRRTARSETAARTASRRRASPGSPVPSRRRGRRRESPRTR